MSCRSTQLMCSISSIRPTGRSLGTLSVRCCTQVVALSLSLLLGACGSGSGSNEPGRESVNTDYSSLSLAGPSAEPLRLHDVETFEGYVKNGLRLRVNNGNYDRDNSNSGAPEAVADNSAGGGNGNFSQTNVHVLGVDEADRVKYDGEHLFIAKSPYYSYWRFAQSTDIDNAGATAPEESLQGIRILSTDPAQAEASAVTEINFPDNRENGALAELYLQSDDQSGSRELVAISDIYTQSSSSGGQGDVQIEPMSLSEDYWGYWGNQNSLIELFDVSSPVNPALVWSLELDGHLINSRKIGSVIYLVTGYEPQLSGLVAWPENEQQRQDNERLIANASMAELLPKYRVDGGDAQPLVTEDNCLLPREVAANEGYASLVTVSAFDLESRVLVSSVCLNAQTQGLYASATSLYLGTAAGPWRERETGLHKFGLEKGQIDYRGTGKVAGSLGWSDPSFRMDEQNGYLRVVTSRFTQTGSKHQLNVLREQQDSDELAIVATLPNELEPAPIGKPNEDIYAVRFLGNRAFIVTFERIDPLYVLDLTDNENPRIAGELEIPGFSTYLHPVGEDYLVSVGQEVGVEGWAQGIKVELFDVRDIANPQSLDRHVVGGEGSWSDALYDLRAFNFLKVGDDQLRFTLPITRRESYEWLDSGLHLYEVNGLTGEQAELNVVGAMIAETNQGEPGYYHPLQAGNGRSRMHGEAVYYVHGNQVWSSFWSSPDQVDGPF